MRSVLLLAVPFMIVAHSASAGDQCDPRKQPCNHLVPSVDIRATVQSQQSNKAVTEQNSDINIQGTAQGGQANTSDVVQRGKFRNVSRTAQGGFDNSSTTTQGE